MENCKYCGKVPIIADVGGNVPYYEISCGCDKGAVVGATVKQVVIDTWNAIQKG